MQEPTEKELTLELVQVLFRHGARTPIQLELNVYQSNDSSAYEKWGTGNLTNAGKKMEYEIGLFLRERYKNFLSSQYKEEEVYACSSDTSRTKMSLQLLFAGLYPPDGHAVWNPDLKWSPLPFSQVPSDLDILLRNYDLPRSKKLIREAYQSEEFQKRISGHSEFLALLAAETKVDCIGNYYNVNSVCGVLIADIYMNLPMPAWYKPELKQKIEELVGFQFDGFAFTLELKKLGVGLLIKKYIENMNLKGTRTNPRKIYLYSAHDVNVGIFTRAHNIEEFRYPGFGSSLIFEKLRDSKNKVYVRLLARTGDGHVVTLKLGGHKEFCPIEEYLKLIEPVIPSDSEIDEMLADVSIPKLKNLLFDDCVVK